MADENNGNCRKECCRRDFLIYAERAGVIYIVDRELLKEVGESSGYIDGSELRMENDWLVLRAWATL